MLTAGDGRAFYADGEKSRTRPFRPAENSKELHYASQDAGQYNSNGVSDQGRNSTSVSAATGISELEQPWKQITFTRYEIQHPTTIENLPFDLLSNIFTRLLAKQLAQMRCVSKSWNALLSQSSFVKSHLHHSINNNSRVLLIFYKEASSSNPNPFALPCQYPHLELSNFIKLPPFNPISGHTTSMLKVIGSIHGLICSCYGDDVIHIWNPSLSAVSTLPPYSMPSCSGNGNFFRFGYDPNTDDYKVLKLSGLFGPPTRIDGSLSYAVKEMLQVEVYSVRKGSWKSITQRFPSHITRIYEPDYLCVDGHEGHLHWLGYSDEGEVHTIVAFDLGLDTFREIPPPDAMLNNHYKLLSVLAGKICVMFWVTGGIEVWVMVEHGVAESWVKREVFSPVVSNFFFGYTSHNEIFIVNEECHLLLYNPTACEANVLKEVFHEEYHVNKIVEYADSLVWITPAVR